MRVLMDGDLEVFWGLFLGVFYFGGGSLNSELRIWFFFVAVIEVSLLKFFFAGGRNVLFLFKWFLRLI